MQKIETTLHAAAPDTFAARVLLRKSPCPRPSAPRIELRMKSGVVAPPSTASVLP